MRSPRGGLIAGVMSVALVASGCTSAPSNQPSPTAAPEGTCGMAGPSLVELAAARGKVFGTAYRSTFAVDDPCYDKVAVSEFGSLTTEIGTMMNTVQPAAGAFDFHEADAVAELAPPAASVTVPCALATATEPLGPETSTESVAPPGCRDRNPDPR